MVRYMMTGETGTFAMPREMTTREKPYCHVVNEGCKAPPATFDSTRAECFACGNHVCTGSACSRRVIWHRYGRRRVCAECLEQERKK
jgi:hypothetical protein